MQQDSASTILSVDSTSGTVLSACFAFARLIVYFSNKELTFPEVATCLRPYRKWWAQIRTRPCLSPKPRLRTIMLSWWEALRLKKLDLGEAWNNEALSPFHSGVSLQPVKDTPRSTWWEAREWAGGNWREGKQASASSPGEWEIGVTCKRTMMI